MSRAVCNSCGNYKDNTCDVKLPLYPDNRLDCWQYRNKQDKYNLAENSKGNAVDRLEGVFKY